MLDCIFEVIDVSCEGCVNCVEALFLEMLQKDGVEFLVVGGNVRRQDGAVERIGFGIEGHRVAHQVGIHPQLRGGVGRAGEGDDVGAVQPVEQVAGTAYDQLQAAFRQQAGRQPASAAP